MWKRVITGLILIPAVIVAALLVSSPWVAVLAGAVFALAAWEWTQFFTAGLRFAGILFVLAISGLMTILSLPGMDGWHGPVMFAGAVWWLLVSPVVLSGKDRSHVLSASRGLKLAAGFIVIIPAWLGLVLLHREGVNYMIFLFFLVWAADIAAYFTGRQWGRRPLSPGISPGKTWEGVAGALAASALVAFLYSVKLHLQAYDIIIFLILCLITVMVSVIGDLFESLMKRSVDLKDSGSLLPGHGGVLDRVDSLTAAVPVFYCAMQVLGYFP